MGVLPRSRVVNFRPWHGSDFTHSKQNPAERLIIIRSLLGASLVLFLGCGTEGNQDGEVPAKPDVQNPSGPATVAFVDVADEVGLHVENVSGGPAQSYIAESASAGAAFLDYDGDGFQDLFFVNGTSAYFGAKLPPISEQSYH